MCLVNYEYYKYKVNSYYNNKPLLSYNNSVGIDLLYIVSSRPLSSNDLTNNFNDWLSSNDNSLDKLKIFDIFTEFNDKV